MIETADRTWRSDSDAFILPQTVGQREQGEYTDLGILTGSTNEFSTTKSFPADGHDFAFEVMEESEFRIRIVAQEAVRYILLNKDDRSIASGNSTFFVLGSANSPTIISPGKYIARLLPQGGQTTAMVTLNVSNVGVFQDFLRPAINP
ncbi:MAG: hypothetical protein AAF950_17755 [Pseudomonadota bacterium]